MSDFGERVDLTANLASILRRYPLGVGLFREIVQNTDDAGAAKQVFILDRQQYKSDKLITDGLEHLQGPALLAYNDAVFSDTDWEAIRNVSQSSKSVDTEKIGKHGLGSRAYYHLTDNPQYLSGTHMAIFDPHRWAFEHGGWRESLENVAAQSSDQLTPFSSIMDENRSGAFPGTVVRLALRPASSDRESRISTKKVTADELYGLLVTFVQEELHLVMLFLSHLTSIEVREIDEHGQERILATATARSQPRELSSELIAGTSTSLHNRTISVEYHDSVRPPALISASCEWIVLWTSFSHEECVDLLSIALDDTQERVSSELRREKLQPNVALAFPAAPASTMLGRLFTYLPLPLITRFPCHIHSVFSLTDSRQNLRNPSETIMPRTSDALAVEWNKMLFKVFIPRAWLMFLQAMAVESGDLPMDIYRCLPPYQDSKTSGDAAYWTSILNEVVELAYERRAAIWPVFSPRDVAYTSLDSALIACSEDDTQQLRMLAKVSVIIVLPPSSLRASLLQFRPELNPQNVRPMLVDSTHLSVLSQSERNVIVEFLLRSGDLRQLIDVSILPLVSGQTVAVRAVESGMEVHFLLRRGEAELFSSLDPNAVRLLDLPPVARTLLTESSASVLNVRMLDSGQAITYTHSACEYFSPHVWSWDDTCAWLKGFWEWIEEFSFANELLVAVHKFPILPTSTGTVRSLGEHVFSYPNELEDGAREVLSRIGIHFLHASIPSGFLEQRRPRLVKSVSNAADLLDALGTVTLDLVDHEVANVLRSHLASCLTLSVSLTDAQKNTLRLLPIYLRLTSDPSSLVVRSNLSGLPLTSPIYCVVNLEDLSTLPLPDMDATFVQCDHEGRPLLEQIDYAAVVQFLTIPRILRLYSDHILTQSPPSRLRVLQFLQGHQSFRTPGAMDKWRTSPIVRVGDGSRWLSPQNILDPQSSISQIVPPGDADAIFDDRAINADTARVLASLRLLRRELDAEYVAARIKFISQRPAQDAKVLANRLLHVLEYSSFDCSDVSYDRELAWIPTGLGLRRPSECRDKSNSLLCDRVIPMLDMELSPSSRLRRMLGWHEPLPLNCIIQQFNIILENPVGAAIPEYLFAITSEFGRRFSSLSSEQLGSIAEGARSRTWVLTASGQLQRPCFAVFKLPSRLRGFAQISMDLIRRAGVREFLLRMGCVDSPTNPAIIDQIELLGTGGRPSKGHAVRDCIDLLDALDMTSVTDTDRNRLLAPGNDDQLHPLGELFYNDLGARARQFELPPGRVGTHPSMDSALCRSLSIPSLGSLHLDPLDIDSEDMREDLTTRISNVLRAYSIDQALNEFLANATDAGAKKFSVMLDNDELGLRHANRSELLCENMAQFCRGAALVVYNDATFTRDDIRGICRIGRGGKENQDSTIGRFGLGALSFYHFSEVAMILSGPYLILLDPSGRYLPEDLRRNSLVTTVKNIRSLYPGHLHVFRSLFGFQENSDHYDGTMIRLPLRSSEQAASSALSKRPLTAFAVHRMVEAYRDVSARSLFFVEIEEITAEESRYTAPLWSVTARRDNQECDGTYRLRRLLIDVTSHNRLPQTTEWLVAGVEVLRDSCPDWVLSVVQQYRLKQLSVALAAEITSVTRRTQEPRQHYFFSALPLPVTTSLPVHVHASFILADDRRNIRWDGDGQLNSDSRTNHWLLTTAVPDLYLCLLEFLARIPSESTSLMLWPGVNDDPQDPLSQTVVDRFYSETCLFSSSRAVFRSTTGRLLNPSSAVIYGAIPLVIKKVLTQLRPDELVQLPPSVRRKVLKLPSARPVSPDFVSEVIARLRDHFLSCYREGEMDISTIEGIVSYLADEKGSAPERLIGLPLLPLADDTLSNIQRAKSFGISPAAVFAGASRNSLDLAGQPWRLFPACRFLHPRMDQHLLLGRELNVRSFDDSAIIELLQEKIPQASERNISVEERAWILGFWKFFDTVSNKLKLDSLKPFPLIPTSCRTTFISLDKAVALPALGIPNPLEAHVLQPLQKLGAIIVETKLSERAQLPSIVRSHLSVTGFSFGRVLEVLHHLNVGGSIQQRFGRLSEDEQHLLAEWIRDCLGKVPTGGHKREPSLQTDVVRYLPIWPAFRGGNASRSLRPISDPLVRLLPSGIHHAADIAFFLASDLHFIEPLRQITRLEIAQPMSVVDFASHLKFPAYLGADMFQRYIKLLDIILALKHRDLSSRLQVPNRSDTMVPVSSLYKSTVPEFQAAFKYRPDNLPHSRMGTRESQLAFFGLRDDMSFENFKHCVEAIHEDFDKESAEDRDKASVVCRWYTTRLALTLSNESQWRQLDSYEFIPRHQSRRSGGATIFRPTEFAAAMPLLVSPSKVLREEHAAVAWTQRALFHETPGRLLFLSDETVGVPSVKEVVQHLCVLALRIAPRYRGNSDLLKDITATYGFLNERHADAQTHLLRHRTEALFLNVNDPETDGWEFHSASQIWLNVPDEENRRDVRAFLRPFTPLLLASGAQEIKRPQAPAVNLSPAEESLSRLRASLNEFRTSRLLTDVAFRVEGDADAGDARNGWRWAHRMLLAASSQHFRDLFCGKFMESGAASVDNPILVSVEDQAKLKCAGLILDYLYTGRFDEAQDYGCLIELLYLAHEWDIADAQRRAEALLISTITPGTYRDLRRHAEQLGATLLRAGVDEYELENAFALGQIGAA